MTESNFRERRQRFVDWFARSYYGQVSRLDPQPGYVPPPLDPKVSNLAVPFYTGSASVRRSRTLMLSDPGVSFQYAGRSSLTGQFDYAGP